MSVATRSRRAVCSTNDRQRQLAEDIVVHCIEARLLSEY